MAARRHAKADDPAAADDTRCDVADDGNDSKAVRARAQQAPAPASTSAAAAKSANDAAECLLAEAYDMYNSLGDIDSGDGDQSSLWNAHDVTFLCRKQGYRPDHWCSLVILHGTGRAGEPTTQEARQIAFDNREDSMSHCWTQLATFELNEARLKVVEAAFETVRQFGTANRTLFSVTGEVDEALGTLYFSIGIGYMRLHRRTFHPYTGARFIEPLRGAFSYFLRAMRHYRSSICAANFGATHFQMSVLWTWMQNMDPPIIYLVTNSLKLKGEDEEELIYILQRQLDAADATAGDGTKASTLPCLYQLWDEASRAFTYNPIKSLSLRACELEYPDCLADVNVDALVGACSKLARFHMEHARDLDDEDAIELCGGPSAMSRKLRRHSNQNAYRASQKKQVKKERTKRKGDPEYRKQMQARDTERHRKKRETTWRDKERAQDRIARSETRAHQRELPSNPWHTVPPPREVTPRVAGVTRDGTPIGKF